MPILRKSHRSQIRSRTMCASTLENLRWSTIVLAISNAVVVLLGGFNIFLVYPDCGRYSVLPFLVVSLASCIRIFTMVLSGIAQEATAKNIIESPFTSSASITETVIRHERRMRYKRWLWWTRFAMIMTVLQFLGATYLVFNLAGNISRDTSNDCPTGVVSNSWKQRLLVFFMVMVGFVALAQCFTGPDVLRWRSYYETQDNAWKAHYREMFDHGIREALCCLGRVKYLSVLEEDEVYSVAQLLGDLVAYRSSGTGHLEFLAGLALLQRHSQSQNSIEELIEAPEEQIQEAEALHKFAEAAYTGPLLDFGRNPLLFPCAWLYRQGILTPWTRNRLPVLAGDNWWRGHAAAFLKYVQLSPEVLRRGRVNQENCEAAYFVVVLHHEKSIVIAVRGTETPEDLITDGLCKECTLSKEDLDGLINSSLIDPTAKKRIESSFPHYAHSGIVEAARDLFMQIEGSPTDAGSESTGFLSSLLGAGCECDGYNVRIVGHSLGGAIGALLGLRLCSRYPNLHVYAYGPLPCLDSVVASACSEIVTSIVHDKEFASRLSVRSIIRLRAAAIEALSEETTADSTMTFRLARRFLYVSKYQRNRTELKDRTPGVYSRAISTEDLDHNIFESQYQYDPKESEEQVQEFSHWTEAETNGSVCAIDHDESTNPIATGINSFDDPMFQIMSTVQSSENASPGDPPEMYIPGLLIHLVPERRSFPMLLWDSWRVREGGHNYKAYLANRENFNDIIVSRSMFLDHLPWRCHNAMQKFLAARRSEGLQGPQLV